MDITAEHSERDIATTVVVIKAMEARKAIGTPLLAALGGEEGYRQAAIRYLDMVAERKQKGLPLRRLAPSLSTDEGDWQELNERWDWEERKKFDGKVLRELPA